MNKRIMMFLTLLLSTLGAAAQNTIAIGNADMDYFSLGQSVSIPVTMDNVDDIVAVELTVKLPRGGSINPDGCQLIASRADGHQISAACIDEESNIYKVTAFSASNKSFKGSSGQLMTLDVVTSQEWLDGHTYAVTITRALLCKINGDNVCIRYTDYADKNRKKLLVIPGEEFIRRFMLHVLPKGFHRVRFSGYLANCCKTANLRHIGLLMRTPYEGNPMRGKVIGQILEMIYGTDICSCPICHCRMDMYYRIRSPDMFLTE